MNRLQERYNNEISKNLMAKFNYKSIMQLPKMEKIVLNIGVGDAVTNSKLLDEAVEELTLISGQKPIITKAKKSIAGFKIREGQAIGCKVTYLKRIRIGNITLDPNLKLGEYKEIEIDNLMC